MAEPSASLVAAEARILARQRLWRNLNQVATLAGRGNITGVRLFVDDVMSDLDDIARLDDELADRA